MCASVWSDWIAIAPAIVIADIGVLCSLCCGTTSFFVAQLSLHHHQTLTHTHTTRSSTSQLGGSPTHTPDTQMTSFFAPSTEPRSRHSRKRRRVKTVKYPQEDGSRLVVAPDPCLLSAASSPPPPPPTPWFGSESKVDNPKTMLQMLLPGNGGTVDSLTVQDANTILRSPQLLQCAIRRAERDHTYQLESMRMQQEKLYLFNSCPSYIS
jgi:hypothetical protein